MSNVAEQLEHLQQRIADGNDEELPVEYLSRLAVVKTEDLYHLDFYGDCFEESYQELLETIARPEVAACLQSLILRGPDEGANGTLNWDLESLVSTAATFSQLETFSVQRNQPGDHNRAIIGAEYQEAGVLARLLARSPRLQQLTVPSAPSEEFFHVGERPLRSLGIDAGYDTQNFIANLAESACFPELRNLEWGEYNETYLDDYLDRCTSLESYQALFASRALSTVSRFVWRNPVCSEAEIQQLKSLRPDLQLLVVRFSSAYA